MEQERAERFSVQQLVQLVQLVHLRAWALRAAFAAGAASYKTSQLCSPDAIRGSGGGIQTGSRIALALIRATEWIVPRCRLGAIDKPTALQRGSFSSGLAVHHRSGFCHLTSAWSIDSCGFLVDSLEENLINTVS
ncbi:MAG: hypothetical protein R3201_00010 [Oceanisphaera sp.]|nr:hypothetical protein [Oceanisphaera sp.]